MENLKNEKKENIIQDEKVKNKKNPLVSVIITMYNTERYLSNSINSLLNQTYKNIEIILVDDKSTDRTKKVAEIFVKNYPDKVRLLCNDKNYGAYISTNRGIIESKGKYITKLDSDDMYFKNKIELQVNELEKYKNYIACSCLVSRIHYITKKVISKCRYDIGFMFRRCVFDKIGYFDSVRFGADSEFIHRLETVYGRTKIKNLNKVLYVALLRPNSLTTSRITHQKSDLRRIYTNLFKYWHKNSKNLYIQFPQKIRPFAVPLPFIKKY